MGCRSRVVGRSRLAAGAGRRAPTGSYAAVTHSGDADLSDRLSPSRRMAPSTQVRTPAVDLGEELVANTAVGVDRRARQLRTMLRAVAITSAGVAILEVVAGFAYRE